MNLSGKKLEWLWYFKPVYLLILIFMVAPSFCNSQSLVLNGGFEEENICTEYKINCAPEAWISNTNGFNNYFNDANRAFEGTHSLAIEAGHSSKPFYRTFVRSKLLCGLRKGHQYLLEFYVKSPHSILDSIGVLFTPYDFLFDKRKLQSVIPSMFVKPYSEKFQEDSSWQKVSLTYTADGSEAFLTIANFSRRDITGNTGIHLVKNFFVFLDEVSMRPLDPNEGQCAGLSLSKDDIYEQNERHQFLQRLIKENRSDPPIVSLPTTSFRKLEVFVFPDVLFSIGKSTPENGLYDRVDSLCRVLKNVLIDSIVIKGHTDNSGTIAINERLSFDRALNVANEIDKCLQLPQGSIRASGYADTIPVADNSSEEGRQMNRRVEVVIYSRE